MFNKPAQQQKNIDTDIPVQPQLTEQSKTSSFLSILKGFLSGNKFVYGMIGLLMLACIVWAYFIV
ncbi:MAG: hypothetical protein QG639_1042, partial [Patescibacteria group bacterium]|nr:hypothetical protein [Patescibacteria group bacterium]